MKRTLNVNIGATAFIIDEDAYAVLKNYLDDIASRMEDEESSEEVVDDIESRIADILRERISHQSHVINIAMVRQAIAVVGRAEYFGDRKHNTPPPHDQDCCGDGMPRRLYRSRKQQAIAGVCGGLAEYLSADVSVIRLISAILILFGGVSLWVYIVLWIIIPMEPENIDNNQFRNKNSRS